MQVNTSWHKSTTTVYDWRTDLRAEELIFVRCLLSRRYVKYVNQWIYGNQFVLLMKFFIMPEFTQALMLFAEPFKSLTDTDLTFERFKYVLKGW